MFGILDRYVGRNVLSSVLLIALCLCLLTGLITLVDKTRYVGRGNVDFLFVCEYVLMHMPGFLVALFPVSTLIGSVVGLGILARNSEIIVMQSGGMSRFNIAMFSLKSLLPVIVLVMAIGEYIVPPLERYAETRLTEESSSSRISINKSGLWIREGDSFIGIYQILSDGSLRTLVRYEVGDNRMKRQTNARSARYVDGAWEVRDALIKTYGEDGVSIKREKVQRWQLNLSPEHINVIGNDSNFLTIKGLFDYIKYLEEGNQDTSRYRLDLYGKLIAPLANIVMMLLALSTVFGPLRSMTMGTRILAGIALGFGYYVLNQMLTPFSLVYGIPPLIGASGATIIFGVLALLLLRRKA